MKIEEITIQMKKLSLRKGDLFILRVKEMHLELGEVEQVMAEAKEILKGVGYDNEVIVLSDDNDVGLIVGFDKDWKD